MLDGRAESTLCGVTGLYVVDFGGGEQERARREAEREAERRRLADRYARYLVVSAEVGQAAARRVITALFDPQRLRFCQVPIGVRLADTIPAVP
jgi:hypothetical protein